jgi:murein DD-endopeptidase MepM/ murein hydrolase activator NlpD
VGTGVTDWPLVAVIVEFATTAGLPPDLLLTLAYAESMLDAFAAGDNGTSCGAFQVHWPVHGGTCAVWQGVAGAERAMALMGAQWLRTFAAHGGAAAWQANPVAFFCGWWPDAQGAEPASAERCVEAVNAGQSVYQEWRERMPGMIPVGYPVTQGFGENPNNGIYGPAGHTGIDYGCPTGTPVRAVRGGGVSFANWLYNPSFPGDQTRGYGLAVLVSDSVGRTWLYGHNSRLDVSGGQIVARGDVLALSGATGATGAILVGGPPQPHLHLELRIDGVPVDPAPYLVEPARVAGTLPVAEDGWRLRAGPGTDTAVLIDGVRAGEKVEVLADGWLAVRARGVEGYVRADALVYGEGGAAAAWATTEQWLRDDLVVAQDLVMRLELQAGEARRRAEQENP